MRVLAFAVGTVLLQGGVRAQDAPEGGEMSPAPAAVEDDGLFRGVRMELGPVRWGGSLGQQYQWSRANTGSRARNRIDTANLTATSYVWQPWLAQLRGGVGVLHSTSQSTAHDSASEGATRGGSTNLTGDLGLALFPVSRFPFDAYANVSDSRTSGELTAGDFRTRRAGARQLYRTADERTRYSARYDQSEITAAGFGRDTLEVFEAGVATRRDAHSVDLNGATSANRGGRDGTDTDTRRASARHGYASGTRLSLETLASLNESTVGSRNALVPAHSASRFRQVTSFGTWRPDEGDALYREGRPLVVTGSGRLFGLESETDASTLTSQTANGTLGAVYAISARTRAAANLSATQATSNGVRTRAAAQSASLAYSPEAATFGAYTYLWNLGATASNASATGQSSRQSGSAQAAHTLSHGSEPTPGLRLVASAGQGTGVAHDAAGNVPTLNHSVGLTASSTGESAITYVGLSATDTRSFGATHTVFQLVNLQATRQHPLSAVSFWSGNFTVQGARQRDAQTTADFVWTRTGSLAYRHQRAFDVPRLRFVATYSASSQQLASRASGDIDAPREITSQSAEARFDYAIGKLELALSARTAVIEQLRNSLLMLRVQRQL